VSPSPTVQVAASETLICFGQTTQLTASGAQTFTWDPGSLSGNTIVVSPASNTTYTVTGVDANGCSNTAYYTVYVQMCNSLAEPGSNFSYAVYPNPAGEIFTIECITDTEINASIEIYEISGNKLKKTEAKFDRSRKSQAVIISDLPKGIYFVKVLAEGRGPKVAKLIKN
jgi:hypothetical protein